jgi:hypothetical protein
MGVWILLKLYKKDNKIVREKKLIGLLIYYSKFYY